MQTINIKAVKYQYLISNAFFSFRNVSDFLQSFAKYFKFASLFLLLIGTAFSFRML